MDTQVIKLVEQFNAEFPNGDSLELAQYVLAHAQDENPDGVLNAHPNDDIETVTLNLANYPKALQNKVEEMVEEGCFETPEEARKFLLKTGICLEVYYEKGQGLFAVESDALDGGADICSPYTRKPIIVPED
jgi:hypothetical protein